MSSLLEQAIIDATALKEAALKNAEAAVLEKYAPEIKQAVEALLEQDLDDPMAALEADPAAAAPEAVDADVDAPLAATEGEDMCPCPDEDEQETITVNFDELTKMAGPEDPAVDDATPAAAALAEETEVDISDELLEAVLAELTGTVNEAEEEEDLEEAKGEKGDADPLDGERAKFDKDHDGVPDGADEDADDPEVQEGLELEEDALAAVVEKLVVDMAQRKTGFLGVSEDTAKYELELELARQQSTDFKEENEALKKAVEELQEKLSNYDFTINEMKRKLDETNLTNARLLYANRILNSTSLNERQKNKLVEAISAAGSVKEAKVIYETLRNTVGTAPDRRGPQSLREAVTRSSSIMSVRENRRNTADPAAERMQILAGIKK